MSALLAMLPTLFQAGKGIYDLVQSNKYSKAERPERETPLALQQRMQGLESMASQTRLPGQSLMEENLVQALSEQLSGIEDYAGSSIDAIGALNQASRGARGIRRDIGIQAAQNQQNNMMNYMSGLNDLANEQSFQWNVNEFQPYQQSMNTAKALQESGIKNLFSGITDLSTVGSSVAAGVSSYKDNNPGATTGEAMKETLKNMQGIGGNSSVDPEMMKMFLELMGMSTPEKEIH